MKKILGIIAICSLAVLQGRAQSYPHYSMFMYNKLIYNPAYAGNKNLTTVNAQYRTQWTGLEGAPETYNVSIDGPVGSYMKPFRRVALGLNFNRETIGVTTNTNIMAIYAYRIPFRKSVLSMGLQAGVSMYSARYSELNIQTPDQRLQADVSNNLLPNFGPGVYWSGENFYLGASIPNLLENYFDKESGQIDTEAGKQIRTYFVSGGYVFTLTDNVKLQPQFLGRYAGNGTYQLPFNADFNLSCILYDRLMIGGTYRTDKTMAAVIHVQATSHINLGYSYDFGGGNELRRYNSGSHEVVVGFDFIRDRNRYANPRFIRQF